MKNVCLITRIKDEEKLIYYNLLYHYNIGIRNFYITFNNSNQETIKKVEQFFSEKKDAIFYPLYENNTEYNQIEQFNKMSEIAFLNGHNWIIPVDADEVLVLKTIILKNLINKYKEFEYGYINFRWVDHIATEKDDMNDPNFFTRWKYREPKCRPPSKTIAKWSPGNAWGHDNHLLISKRRLLEEVPIETGFYAHFVNREYEQIKKKRIRIGEAFLEKYGSESDKPQIQEYRRWLAEGEQYFVNVWDKLCKYRKDNFEKFIYDPINPVLFS